MGLRWKNVAKAGADGIPVPGVDHPHLGHPATLNIQCTSPEIPNLSIGCWVLSVLPKIKQNQTKTNQIKPLPQFCGSVKNAAESIACHPHLILADNLNPNHPPFNVRCWKFGPNLSIERWTLIVERSPVHRSLMTVSIPPHSPAFRPAGTWCDSFSRFLFGEFISASEKQ